MHGTTRLKGCIAALAGGAMLVTSAVTLAGSATADPGQNAETPSEASVEPHCLPGAPPDEVETESLGTGSETFPITASGLIEETHYVVTRHMSLTPGVIAGYDTGSEEVVYDEEIVLDGENSEGTWGATVSGEDLYVGMSFDGDRRSSILRVEHESGELTEVGSTHPAELIWAMDTAPDGVVYAATSRQNQAGLWEYDPSTEETEFLGHFEEVSRQDARSVAATEETVYLGLGNAAPDLFAYDRDSGDSTSILPDELSDASYVYTLAATEDYVAVGTSSPSTLTVIDQENHDDYEVVDIPSGTVQSLEIVDDVVYLTGSDVLWSYDIITEELTELADLEAVGAQTRGLFYADGLLHGSSNIANVWTYDVEAGELEAHDLIEAGVSAAGEPAQSLAVSADEVVTGGHMMMGVRDRASDDLKQVNVPGEAKDTVLLDNTLYMAMYSGGDLVSYDLQTEEIETLGTTLDGHNRPRDMHHDPATSQLLMAVQADTDGGGSLLVHDLDSEETTNTVPFEDRATSAVTSAGGAVYIGGSSGMQDPSDEAVVAEWDLESEEVLWEVSPDPEASTITGLAELDGYLYGVTDQGTLFVIETGSQEVVATESGFDVGDVIEHQGGIYGATEDELFAVDTHTFETTVLLDGLGGQWFTWPGLASDGCDLFIMSGFDVLQISDGEEAECTETITGTHNRPLRIGEGVTCLDGATVNGPVIVDDGAGIVASAAQVSGPVRAEGAQLVHIEDSEVRGPVQLRGGSGAVHLVDNEFTGRVTVHDNHTDTEALIAGNTISGPLACAGNDPAPTNDGNENSVTGSQQGQCANL